MTTENKSGPIAFAVRQFTNNDVWPEDEDDALLILRDAFPMLEIRARPDE